ncbi:PglL family O-oligosaccharyltransferase [Vibrio ostreicida]|uniref:PglL family O-oligosaccharyltransferase n=1 Tax=Vibrio ostreicida TaxID=526588 RepID=UPI003B5BBAD6
MATLHLAGTRLEPQTPKLPLTRPFLASVAIMFLLAMHVFIPNPGGEGLALSFNITTWIALSFSLALGFYQIGTQGKIRYNKLTIGLLICCLMMTLPVFYPSSNFSLAQGRLTGLWAGFSLFFALQQFQFSNKQKQRLLWFICIATLIQALFGWFQYLFLQDGNLFGYNNLENRPYGIFQQPNVMASFLATGLALSGYLLARHPKKYHRQFSETALLYLLPAITLPLLIFLASRTGWLTAFAAALLLLPYIYNFATQKRFWGWLLSIFIGLCLGGAISIQSDNTLLEEKKSLQSSRQTFYPQTLDMLIEKPFTGYGYGRFEPEYLVYTARQHQLNPNYPPGFAGLNHPHNELLYWGVEGGAIPMLAILLAAMMIMIRIYNTKKGTRLAMLALLMPIILHNQLEQPFYHSAIHWCTFVILLFWIDQRSRTYRQVSLRLPTKMIFRITSLITPILACFYLITALHTNYVLIQFETSSPKEPELLNQVSNPIVWKDRFDWDIYSTYLNIGLAQQKAEYIQPYIDWSLNIIKEKPRPAFYNNLILAYQGLNETEKAEQIRSEAQFLFPRRDFSVIRYIPPDASVLERNHENAHP